MTGGSSAGNDQEPTKPPSHCFLPARQPESNNKVIYFNGITLATAAATLKLALTGGYSCVNMWTLNDPYLTKSVTCGEHDTWLQVGCEPAWGNIQLERFWRNFTAACSLFINWEWTIYWWQAVNNDVPSKCRWNQFSLWDYMQPRERVVKQINK